MFVNSSDAKSCNETCSNMTPLMTTNSMQLCVCPRKVDNNKLLKLGLLKFTLVTHPVFKMPSLKARCSRTCDIDFPSQQLDEAVPGGGSCLTCAVSCQKVRPTFSMEDFNLEFWDLDCSLTKKCDFCGSKCEVLDAF